MGPLAPSSHLENDVLDPDTNLLIGAAWVPGAAGYDAMGRTIIEFAA